MEESTVVLELLEGWVHQEPGVELVSESIRPIDQTALAKHIQLVRQPGAAPSQFAVALLQLIDSLIQSFDLSFEMVYSHCVRWRISRCK